MAATFQTGSVQVIGRRRDAYDFKDEETGNQVKGETHVLIVWDPAQLKSHDVKIKNASLGLFDEIPEGDHIVAPFVVRLSVEVYARGNRTTQTAVGLAAA